MMSRFLTGARAVVAGLLAVCAVGGAAQAQTLLNGNFSTVTGGAGTQITGTSAGTSNAGGWYTNLGGGTGCTSIVNVATATNGFSGGCDTNQRFWYSGNGGSGTIAASPDGGNFLASDSDYHTDTISQDLTGLVTGATYVVSFWQAGAQQYGFGTLATTDQWTVSLGASSKQAALISVPLHTFSNWTFQQLSFIASATNLTLSFLATGGPVGQPPYALLDGVTIARVPEPASGALLLVALAGLVARRGRLRRG